MVRKDLEKAKEFLNQDPNKVKKRSEPGRMRSLTRGVVGGSRSSTKITKDTAVLMSLPSLGSRGMASLGWTSNKSSADRGSRGASLHSLHRAAPLSTPSGPSLPGCRPRVPTLRTFLIFTNRIITANKYLVATSAGSLFQRMREVPFRMDITTRFSLVTTPWHRSLLINLLASSIKLSR